MFPPVVDLNPPTEPNLNANSTELMLAYLWLLELTNVDVVIVENEDELDHLIVPLCADAIEIEGHVLKSENTVI
jgi:hypothetical protein